MLTSAVQKPFAPGSLFLAPMVGLSHRALRSLILEFGGLDHAYTEMASAAAMVSGSPYERWYLDTDPQPEKTIVQLYTVKPEHLLEALSRLESSSIMGIDINFGCAAPSIERSGGGVAWMSKPRQAAALFSAARAQWKGLLSAKLRIGAHEDYDALRDFCSGLVDAGADFLCIHPRLKDQKFRGRGRWDFVSRLAAELPLPIIGNGDIRRFADFRARLEASGASGLMLGREAARRPWIFALIRGRQLDPDFSMSINLEAVALRFLELVEKFLPADFHHTRARRFFFYYADNVSFAHHLRWRLQNAASLDDMRAELATYFREVPGDRMTIQGD